MMLIKYYAARYEVLFFIISCAACSIPPAGNESLKVTVHKFNRFFLKM